MQRFLLLSAGYHYTCIAAILLAGVIISYLLAQWQHNAEVTAGKVRYVHMQRQLTDYSQSSRLHKLYLEQLRPLPLAQAMNMADNWVSASGGKLLRLEHLTTEDNKYRLEARFGVTQFYAWLTQINNSRVLLDHMLLEQEGETLLVRATHSAP